jgi:hypothetical protein
MNWRTQLDWRLYRSNRGSVPAGGACCWVSAAVTPCVNNERFLVQRKTRCYWAEMVKPCGRLAAITAGDAAVTGEVTCGFPAESM